MAANLSSDRLAQDTQLPITERIAQALREQKTEGFKASSPYAACLLPLLKELGWHTYARELLETLPHFSDQLDLVDLRNILVALGYESSPLKRRLDKINAELYPCLFLGKNGEILVLLNRVNDEIEYFDARQEKVLKQFHMDMAGTAYVFTDNTISHSAANVEQNPAPWFMQLLKRFKKFVIHLLSMTFFINLVALLVPLFIMTIYDKVIGAKSADSLPYLIAGIAILMLTDLVLRYLRAKLLGSMAGRLDYLIGVETFKQLLYMPPLYTERSTLAAQLSRLKQFDSVRDFFTGQCASIALELPFALLFIIVIACLSGWIALIPLAMIVAYLVFGMLWLPNLNAKVFNSGKARTNKQRLLMQTLAGRKEIKAIGGEPVWRERFREYSGEAVMTNYQTFVGNAVMNSVAQALMTLAGVAVAGFGALAVIDGSMTIGALIATMALVWRVLSPLQSSFLSYSKFQQTLKAIQQINQLMRIKTERHGSHAALILAEITGRVVVDRVSFRYGPDLDPSLLGVSMKVEPGQLVAVIGHTGSGKSSVLKLIAGMYRPQAGSLMIDDMDIRQLNAMDLRRAISYVPQEAKMFHGTIAQNMRLNNGLATDEELEHAAQDAGILEDIRKMPEGFNTRIGDNFTQKYPPGFLRALSMARAFVNPAKIILLDEPGASLDDASDQRFVQQLKNLKGRRTIIMVSHRPSHIRLADQALLLENGTVRYFGESDEAIGIMMESMK